MEDLIVCKSTGFVFMEEACWPAYTLRPRPWHMHDREMGFPACIEVACIEVHNVFFN